MTAPRMLDLALFVNGKKGWKKLSSYETAVPSDDDKELGKAFVHFRKQAQLWANNCTAYYTAQFAIFSSPHGKAEYKLLRRI